MGSDLGPLPLIHHREKLVYDAMGKLRQAIASADLYQDLTVAEQLTVLAHVFNDEILGILKYAIRKERHGDTDKPGGFE